VSDQLQLRKTESLETKDMEGEREPQNALERSASGSKPTGKAGPPKKLICGTPRNIAHQEPEPRLPVTENRRETKFSDLLLVSPGVGDSTGGGEKRGRRLLAEPPGSEIETT